MSDDMLLLHEQEALRRFFDDINARRLRVHLWVLLSVFAVYSVVAFAEQRIFPGSLAVAAVVAFAVVLHLRNSQTVLANIRPTCAGCLLGAYLILVLIQPRDAAGAVLWLLVLWVLASRLRLGLGEHTALFGALYAIFAVRTIIVEQILLKGGLPLVQLLVFGAIGLLLEGAALGLVRRSQRVFLARWRAESVRHRDRLRMKQELEYARHIQLSMLPRQAPSMGWLDVAALSIPATEVGGDYYDYFLLGDERLAVVVGDVTGHGVASGLVLSGVRASLNLLQEEMDVPQQILGRVNRMLKRTATPRMLMTLGLAVLDRDSSSLTMATAGHPPALVLRHDRGEIDEVGRGALPLGAMARAEYAQDRVALSVGDVVLLYSDGLVETSNLEGAQYGWERLRRVVQSSSGESSAQAVRDAVLRDLWDFKGDAEQVDDVTMVAIRIRG